MSERIAFTATVTTEGRRIRGAVQLAGQRTRRGGEWLEIDPAAIVKADASEVVGRWEHDPHKILGRPENGTLVLTRTDQGIEYELTDLPDTTYANDALALVRGGYVTGSSFEIQGIKSQFSVDPDTGERIRRITHIDRLTDVSPVGQPAFTASTAAAFSEESEVTAPHVEVEAIASATPAEEKSEAYRSAERYAREQTDLAAIEAAMDALLTGEMTAAKSEAYAAFADVYDERKRLDTEARERKERMELANGFRKGIIPRPASGQSELYASADYLHAFNRYMRTGDKVLMEQFAQSIAGDGSQGGYMVPDSFLTRITERQKAYGGIRRVAEVITTSDGRTLPWPTNDDTANSAAIVAEGVSGTAGADLVFGTVSLGAFSYSSNGTGNIPLKVSRELLQDAAFDVEAFVGRKLGERIGRKQAADLATGAGTTLPFGLLTKTPDTLTATKTRAAAVEMEFHVDAAYREQGNCVFVMSDTVLAYREQGNCVFVMSDTVLALYRSAVDTTGRPLWLPNAESGMTTRPGGTLNGYPVIIDNGAGTLVAFGDIRLGYIIRDVRSIEVLVDPYSYSSTRQIGYHAWARMDANVQDAYAYSVAEFSGVTADATA